MPAAVAPLDTEDLARKVRALGQQIRTRRKALAVSATAAAEAAGMSRVTWHRIEAGATTVTIAAWFNALEVLGLEFGIGRNGDEAPDDLDAGARLPLRIPLATYPRLAALAWQVPATAVLKPRQVWDIVRRNRRHLEPAELDDAEQTLIAQLQQVFGEFD